MPQQQGLTQLLEDPSFYRLGNQQQQFQVIEGVFPEFKTWPLENRTKFLGAARTKWMTTGSKRTQGEEWKEQFEATRTKPGLAKRAFQSAFSPVIPTDEFFGQPSVPRLGMARPGENPAVAAGRTFIEGAGRSTYEMFATPADIVTTGLASGPLAGIKAIKRIVKWPMLFGATAGGGYGTMVALEAATEDNRSLWEPEQAERFFGGLAGAAQIGAMGAGAWSSVKANNMRLRRFGYDTPEGLTAHAIMRGSEHNAAEFRVDVQNAMPDLIKVNKNLGNIVQFENPNVKPSPSERVAIFQNLAKVAKFTKEKVFGEFRKAGAEVWNTPPPDYNTRIQSTMERVIQDRQKGIRPTKEQIKEMQGLVDSIVSSPAANLPPDLQGIDPKLLAAARKQYPDLIPQSGAEKTYGDINDVRAGINDQLIPIYKNYDFNQAAARRADPMVQLRQEIVVEIRKIFAESGMHPDFMRRYGALRNVETAALESANQYDKSIARGERSGNAMWQAASGLAYMAASVRPWRTGLMAHGVNKAVLSQADPDLAPYMIQDAFFIGAKEMFKGRPTLNKRRIIQDIQTQMAQGVLGQFPMTVSAAARPETERRKLDPATAQFYRVRVIKEKQGEQQEAQ